MAKIEDCKVKIVITDAVYDQDGKLKKATVLVPRSHIESEIVKTIDNEMNKRTSPPPVGLLNAIEDRRWL